jgi:hypothetical protein
MDGFCFSSLNFCFDMVDVHAPSQLNDDKGM